MVGTMSGARTRLAHRLLAWYRRSKRDLPWRRDRDPYRVWVSEIMLQQTRVEVVAPRFVRFLERFPSVEALARSPIDDVLAEWSGLGYYSRARSLHAAAQAVHEQHGGRFPRDVEAALALPGIGRYTAGAILSIAYGLPAPIVDGNVERVLTRVHALAGDPRKAPLKERLWTLAASLIPPKRASEFNQALMELGATVCLPRGPKCEVCPLSALCKAHERGEPARFPELKRDERQVKVRLAALLVEREGQFLLERRAKTDERGAPAYLRGLWGFPCVEISSDGDIAHLFRRLETVAGPLQAGTTDMARLGSVRHAITFRRITLEAFRVSLRNAPRVHMKEARGCWKWAPLASLGAELPASSLALKIRSLAERASASRGARES